MKRTIDFALEPTRDAANVVLDDRGLRTGLNMRCRCFGNYWN